MNEQYITLAQLTKEIYDERSVYTDYASFERKMREKYNFLTNRIVMRNKLDWRYKKKDWIPLKDKSIIKALLIKSYTPLINKDEDQVIVDWFNNKIDGTDFERIILLGERVERLIKDQIAYDDWELDNVTIDEWVNVIHSSINYSKALSVKKLSYEMIQLYDSSSVLNHNIPFGDIIEQTEYGKRLYVWQGLHPNIDMSLPLNEVLKGCFSQDDYVNLVLQLIIVITNDSQKKTVDFIKAYAEVKKMTGFDCIDECIGNDTLASEYAKFFQNIYDFLYNKPQLTEKIETEIGTDNLLDFFKMKDRNTKKPKETKDK